MDELQRLKREAEAMLDKYGDPTCPDYEKERARRTLEDIMESANIHEPYSTAGYSLKSWLLEDLPELMDRFDDLSDPNDSSWAVQRRMQSGMFSSGSGNGTSNGNGHKTMIPLKAIEARLSHAKRIFYEVTGRTPKDALEAFDWCLKQVDPSRNGPRRSH